MSAQHKYVTDDLGNDTDVVAATIIPASAQAVEKVLTARVGDNDGRSEWKWVLFPNGDWMLACYPCGDTYLATDYDRGF